MQHNPIMLVRLTVHYHQPLGTLDGTKDFHFVLERFDGEDDAAMIRKAIRHFRLHLGDRWHRIESVNLHPGRWNADDAVPIDEHDEIAGASGDAA